LSNEAVQAVLERTLVDEAFRAQLFAEPEKALEGYDLTSDESVALRTLSIEAEAAGSGELDQRASKRALWAEFL